MATETMVRENASNLADRDLFEAFPRAPIFEFRDTSFRAQVAMGVVGALGAAAVIGAVKSALGGQPAFFAAAGVAAIAALAGLGFVYWKFGQPAGLRLTAGELVLIRGGEETVVPLDELAAFRAEWKDLSLNGIYQQTRVQFQFASDDPGAPPLFYDAQATFGAAKFDQLQQFQLQIAETIARRMQERLSREGRLSWTERLALTPTGLEIKDRSDAPRIVSFAQLTRWEVDQGLFKLAVDGVQKPSLVEKANQWNFYPGLALLERLTT